MNLFERFELLFEGIDSLGPGSDRDTLHVLRGLPRHRFDVVVDAGCGKGRQTLTLARELDTAIDAVDLHEPFLDVLRERAAAAGLAGRVRTHCMDMKDVPDRFPTIDLLWSESAAYSIGFGDALSAWAGAIAPGGLVVASEISWLRDAIDDDVLAFWDRCYPDLRSIPGNEDRARDAGYRVLSTYTLPDASWSNGFYDRVEPRARDLADHPDAGVREIAAETLEEAALHRRAGDQYGYVFYVLERA